MFLLPAITTLISLVFAGQVLNQYRVRGRSHQLAWGLALLFYAVAAFPEAVAAISGWSELGYKIYYLFGALLLVPWLSLGTSELLLGSGRARVARHVYRYFVAGVTVVGVIAVYLAPLHTGHLATTESPSNCAMFCASEQGYGVFNVISLIEAIAGNSIGTVVLVGGALYSAWRTYRAGLPRNLTLGNVLILVGSLVVATAASLTRFGSYQFFYAGQAAGIAIIFAGFLLIGAASHARATQPV